MIDTGRLRRSWAELIPLAWPVMLSRFGILFMAIVDVAMLGRQAGTEQLAFFALGMTVALPVMITGIGATTGILARAAQAHGRADTAALRQVFRDGLMWAATIGALALAVILSIGPLLHFVGHRPEMIAGTLPVARALAPGAFIQILFVACAFWLEATGRTRPALYGMIVANIVNIALNTILIGEMGAVGAAWATNAARLSVLLILLSVVLTRPEIRAKAGAAMSELGPIAKIGAAGGVAYFFETMAFAALGQFAGLLGTSELAAYSIAHNLEAALFMVALGLSVAAAVRVGAAAGRGNLPQARFDAFAALALALMVIAALGAILVLFAQPVASLFSAEAALLARVTPLFAVLAFSLLFDAGQVVMGQCARALGDTWLLTGCYFVGFWCVMVPAGYILSMMTPLAEMGLFVATGLGCAVTFLMLLVRIVRLTQV
ncbi:MATE family efflux transporter [Pontivivens insulae]|uniref:Multidrug-efflux transporter n=1 Tax=Pontivivens insulae TaxID=1639689 RepID=A0A2R8ACQ8_9RHOB|nr:MATE family efflux transporter [Pontivivens insulae]RED13940.1 MATE family multidrug resistance protein [Pontivivens insulae]SPF30014.1 Multidrug resistance protein MdtK [Pontivivens insulae]